MPFMENFVLMDGENGKKWYRKRKGWRIRPRPGDAVREGAACEAARSGREWSGRMP